mgnify:CR=1 FL=1
MSQSTPLLKKKDSGDFSSALPSPSPSSSKFAGKRNILSISTYKAINQITRIYKKLVTTYFLIELVKFLKQS